MIDLLRVNQRLRAGVALKAAWEGFDDDLAAVPDSPHAGPPEAWGMAIVAAQLSWQQVGPVRDYIPGDVPQQRVRCCAVQMTAVCREGASSGCAVIG